MADLFSELFVAGCASVLHFKADVFQMLHKLVDVFKHLVSATVKQAGHTLLASLSMFERFLVAVWLLTLLAPEFHGC